LPKNPKEREAASGRPRVFSPNRGLPIGAPAPDFAVQSVDDEELSLSRLISGGIPVLIAFFAPNCPPCEALLPVLEHWDRELSEKLTVAVISSGTSQDDVYALADTQLLHVADNGSRVHKDYDAAWTPSAVLISPQGTVASRLANGAAAVEELMRHFAGNQKNPWLGAAANKQRDDAEPAAPQFGDPAPLFSLRDRNERSIGLSDFLGRRVLLLFWNANCSFCKRMAPDIRAFEDDPPGNEPQILIITNGSVRSARQYGFRSPVLPARNSKVDEKYGVQGTPSALLIDEEGRIASSLETEATGILKLLGVRRAQPAI
jgi:peroxiredoxin